MREETTKSSKLLMVCWNVYERKKTGHGSRKREKGETSGILCRTNLHAVTHNNISLSQKSSHWEYYHHQCLQTEVVSSRCFNLFYNSTSCMFTLLSLCGLSVEPLYPVTKLIYLMYISKCCSQSSWITVGWFGSWLGWSLQYIWHKNKKILYFFLFPLCHMFSFFICQYVLVLPIEPYENLLSRELWAPFYFRPFFLVITVPTVSQTSWRSHQGFRSVKNDVVDSIALEFQRKAFVPQEVLITRCQTFRNLFPKTLKCSLTTGYSASDCRVSSRMMYAGRFYAHFRTAPYNRQQ